MTKFRDFATRLFSLRNLAPFLIIVGAVIGSLGLTPFGIQFKTDQIIMALLTFLAIDSLVERLDLLTNIEQGVLSIRRTLSSKVTADAFLKTRKQFPRMEQLIHEARSEIWVAGITLDTMVTLVSAFEAKMAQGCNLRFLALAPEEHTLQVAARHYASDPNFLFTRIRSNLTAINSRLRSTTSGSMEVRVIDTIFPTGYFIIDPFSPHGKMIIQLYLYQCNTEGSPLFDLSKTEDANWFAIYLHQFEKAWNDAKKFDDEPSYGSQHTELSGRI